MAGNNSVFWDTTEKTDAINHAIEVWQLLVGEWTISGTISSVTAGLYTTPSPVVVPLRVATLTEALCVTSVEELDMGVPQWQNAFGTNGPEMWAPVGIN